MHDSREAEARSPAERSRPRVAALATLAVWVGYSAVVAALALRLHPLPLNEAESDNFLRGLTSLLQGGGHCIDGYHPAHTVLVGWLVAKSTGWEAFTTLRVVAALGGGAVVVLTFWLARRFGAARIGAGLAASLIALHPGLLVLAMQASADAFATAAMLATLLAAVHARSATSGRATLLCGLAFGFSVGTRFSCVGFAPALLAAVHRGRIGSDLVRLTVGVVIGYLPHGIVSTLEYGSPLFTYNWRNFVLKHGGFDALLLVDPGYPNLVAFLREHWVESLQLGFTDVRQQVQGDFGRLLSGGLPAPASWLVGGVALAAILALAVRRRPTGTVLGLCFATYLALVCLAYAPIERVVLPLFPLAAIALGALVGSGRRWANAVGIVTLVLLCSSLVFHLPARLQQFVDAHPLREIEVARAVAERPEVELLATTYSYMPQFGPASTYVYPVAPGPSGQLEPYAHLRREVARTGANAFVVGRRSSPLTHRALRAAIPPDDVHILAADDDVVAVVFDVVHRDGEGAGRWFESFTATPLDWFEGPLDVQVELTDSCELLLVASVSVQIELPQGKGPTFELPVRGDRRWGIAWPLRPPPGPLQIASRLRLRDGRHVRGPVCRIQVR